MVDLNILTYGIGLDGFFRVAASLPEVSSKQTVTVIGQDEGAPFETSADIILCPSIHIDISPEVVTIEDGSFNTDKIHVKFSTYDFTPTSIFAFLGSVQGSNCENTIILPENEINDFKLIRSGRKNTFIFDFPQGEVTEGLSTRPRVLSDIFDIDNMFSMSQPLMIGLQIESENYSISNYEQLSVSNMVKNFSVPVKFSLVDTIKDSSDNVLGGFNFRINNVYGTEDNPGNVQLDMVIEKVGGLAISNSASLAPSVSILPNGTERTNLSFGGGAYSTDNPLSDIFLKDTRYQQNKQFDLLKTGVLHIADGNHTYAISTSHTENNFSVTRIGIDTDVTEQIVTGDNTFKDLLITDFLPTHCRVHSSRGHVSEEIKLNLREYSSSNKIELEPENFPNGSIIDDGFLSLELIDKAVTGYSIIKKIDTIDRSSIGIPITSDLFGSYFVDIGFFIYFDEQSEIFWVPLKVAPDGTVGIPAAAIDEFLFDLDNPEEKHNKIYVRLESNRIIQSVAGEIRIGNNSIEFNTETDDRSKVSPKNRTVAWKEVDFEEDIVELPDSSTKLPINYDLNILDPNGNPFQLTL